MLANLKKGEHGYIARFERYEEHSVEKVWSMLTENDKLATWFSELRIDELRKGGIIKFDMQDGTFEEFTITDFKLNSVLEFTWDKDLVRFELYPEQDGCLLVLIEKIETITDHTPRDLAGWHVCLEVIQALLDGRKIDSREEEWEQWYEKYVVAVKEVLV
ncbi:SRPBCC family protein [Peribacillus loiseleuriae]|uniref:Activator of Hsp90 ATPase 1 family protein n=1 Tax=Peribacillus loiseleuriae TaxID=1679170 RepID=A0A0K9GZ36_9BACI|nr:SRPBCC family protein [Peribacillus loiseleuriae]KMY51507.1 activator of Hsp90 ATPase 1 family protein [Peribacillus loiseleuriae]